MNAIMNVIIDETDFLLDDKITQEIYHAPSKEKLLLKMNVLRKVLAVADPTEFKKLIHQIYTMNVTESQMEAQFSVTNRFLRLFLTNFRLKRTKIVSYQKPTTLKISKDRTLRNMKKNPRNRFTVWKNLKRLWTNTILIVWFWFWVHLLRRRKILSCSTMKTIKRRRIWKRRRRRREERGRRSSGTRWRRFFRMKELKCGR